MKETVYIFSNGELKRKDNTLSFITNDGNKKYIPVEHIKEIFAFGEITLNAKALNFLSQKHIILHYFNYYGYYAGSFYAREHYNSGFMILKQANFYQDNNKRKTIAEKIIKGAAKNALKNLKYYHRRNENLQKYIDKIENFLPDLNKKNTINQMMAVEGQIKQTYYASFNQIISNDNFAFKDRNRRPPKDKLNALISFANAIIYTQTLSEIYQTHLDPRIGYLHSTNFRSFTLNLDIAEIFKPVIGDKVIFSIINKGIIKEKDFEKELNSVTLNDNGRKKFLKNLEKRLSYTIKHHTLKKKVSYRRLIRLELYKLEKHLMEEKNYQPFVMDW